jgi:hypothetical protein
MKTCDETNWKKMVEIGITQKTGDAKCLLRKNRSRIEHTVRIFLRKSVEN